MAMEAKRPDRVQALAGLVCAVLVGLGAYSTVSYVAGGRGVVSSWTTEAQKPLCILTRD